MRVSSEVQYVAHRSTAGQSGIPAVGAGAALFPHLPFPTTHTCARLFTGCSTPTVIPEPAGRTGTSMDKLISAVCCPVTSRIRVKRLLWLIGHAGRWISEIRVFRLVYGSIHIIRRIVLPLNIDCRLYIHTAS